MCVCVCVHPRAHGSHTVVEHQLIDNMCTLSLIMYTSKCPDKTAFTASLPKTSSQTTRRLETFAHFLYNLAAFAGGFFFIIITSSKLSVNSPLLKTTAGRLFSAPAEARWGLYKFQTDQSQPTATSKYTTPLQHSSGCRHPLMHGGCSEPPSNLKCCIFQ